MVMKMLSNTTDTVSLVESLTKETLSHSHHNSPDGWFEKRTDLSQTFIFAAAKCDCVICSLDLTCL